MARPVITDKPILDQAEFNGVTIWRKEGGSIEVSDINYPSMKAALLDIAQKAEINVEKGWNTQYLGWYIIQQLKKAGDINIGSSEDGIIAELALSQQYDLEVDDNNMVVLSKTNVAKVEAMIRNDSDYINNTPSGPIDEKDFNTDYYNECLQYFEKELNININIADLAKKTTKIIISSL